jgi:HKD family nuclease
MTTLITKLSDNLLNEIKNADEIWIAVALIKIDGLNFLIDNLKSSCKQNYLVGVNLPTDPESLTKLYKLELSSNINIRLYAESENFHPKLYLIRENNNYSAFIGSANCTNGGLFNNIELTVRTNDQIICFEIKDWFFEQYNKSKPLTEKFIEKYRADYLKRIDRKKEDERLIKKEKRFLNNAINKPMENIITFPKNKKQTWNKGMITIPADFKILFDSKYNLKKCTSTNISILLPSNIKLSGELYHGENNKQGTPYLYYQFKIHSYNRSPFIDYISNKTQFSFEFDLDKREVKIV